MQSEEEDRGMFARVLTKNEEAGQTTTVEDNQDPVSGWVTEGTEEMSTEVKERETEKIMRVRNESNTAFGFNTRKTRSHSRRRVEERRDLWKERTPRVSRVWTTWTWTEHTGRRESVYKSQAIDTKRRGLVLKWKESKGKRRRVKETNGRQFVFLVFVSLPLFSRYSSSSIWLKSCAEKGDSLPSSLPLLDKTRFFSWTTFSFLFLVLFRTFSGSVASFISMSNMNDLFPFPFICVLKTEILRVPLLLLLLAWQNRLMKFGFILNFLLTDSCFFSSQGTEERRQYEWYPQNRWQSARLLAFYVHSFELTKKYRK